MKPSGYPESYGANGKDVGVGHISSNATDAPSEEEIFAAEGWNVFDRCDKPAFTREQAQSLSGVDRLIVERNSLYAAALRHCKSNPRADCSIALLMHYTMATSGPDGCCWQSFDTIAKLLSRSERSLREARDRLETAGEIVVIKRPAYTDIVVANLDVDLLKYRQAFDLINAISAVVAGSGSVKSARPTREVASREKEDTGVWVYPDQPRKPTAGVCEVSSTVPTKIRPEVDFHSSHLRPEADFRSKRQNAAKTGSPAPLDRKSTSDEDSLVINLSGESTTTVELVDRGSAEGERKFEADASRSLSVQSDVIVDVDYRRQREPAVEVTQLVATPQLPVKKSKRAVADHGPLPTPIDPTWELNDAGRQYARDQGLSDQQIDDAAFSFFTWHNENSHLARGRFKDWGRRWMDWARKQAGQLRERGTLGALGQCSQPAARTNHPQPVIERPKKPTEEDLRIVDELRRQVDLDYQRSRLTQGRGANRP